MARGRAVRGFGLAVTIAALSGLPVLANPTWDRGPASYVETIGQPPPPGPARDRPAWPISARLGSPTDRYDHDILGGIPRWTALAITALACGACRGGRATYSFALPDDMVFEDIAPRLWDVTGDGRPEVVVVETALALGARLAVWGFDSDGTITRLATTDFIGTPHRWLAPVAAGDLDGDGRIELAYVDRPHLARDLVIVRLAGPELREVARATGFTAHRIGDRSITAALRSCGGGRAELILPDATWSQLMALRLTSGRIEARQIAPMSATALSAAVDQSCD